eukprot:TRINITY_DN26780_c0_g1_i1.p1 TRINITY_DN26780_c0_g1~~TRINITY_DN26780_c0_g1_i1.p1  ORF type:complete len:378 (-),score=40.88 TRINITY_DN26780_c0_g1_i1:262-1395(-)
MSIDWSSPTSVAIVASFGTVSFCCVSAAGFAVCKVLQESRREKAIKSNHARTQHAKSMAVVKRQGIAARASIIASRLQSSQDDSHSDSGSEERGADSDGDGNDIARTRAKLAQKHRVKSQASQNSFASDPMVLPDKKSYHYYLSYEKAHSRYKKTPERLAQELYDALLLQGFSGYRNVDDTSQTEVAKLKSSCAVIAMLHDQAFTDRSVMHWQVAKQDQIPIVFIVDRSRHFVNELQEEMEGIDPEMLERKWIEYADGAKAECVEKTVQWLKKSLVAARTSVKAEMAKKRSSVSARRSSTSGTRGSSFVKQKPTSVLPGQPDEDSDSYSSSSSSAASSPGQHRVGAAHVVDDNIGANGKRTRLMKRLQTRRKKKSTY